MVLRRGGGGAFGATGLTCNAPSGCKSCSSDNSTSSWVASCSGCNFGNCVRLCMTVMTRLLKVTAAVFGQVFIPNAFASDKVPPTCCQLMLALFPAQVNF